MIRLGLFAGQRVGREIAAFLAAQGAEPECLVLDARDPGGWNATIRAAARMPDPARVLGSDELEGDGLERLRALELDLIVLAWWPYIIRENLISLPRLGCLNFHPSLLPVGRGKHPNFWALRDGTPYGVTIHWVDPGVDSGDIAYQRELPVSWEDTGVTLHERGQRALLELFEQHWTEIARGEIPRRPQGEDGSFHRAAELEGASEIDLDASYRARDLLDLLRARTFPPHPGAWFSDGGRRFEARIEIAEGGFASGPAGSPRAAHDTATREQTMTLDRHDVFPHVEDVQTMTLREWLYFHNVMHRHYTHYLGRKVLKPPFDWIVMQDIISDTKPDLIVEIGSFEGGFALWMAHLLDAMESDATIIGVDVSDRPTAVKHPRIKWVIGDATAPETIARVRDAAEGRRGMVLEDSDHKYHVTKALLEGYEEFVAPDKYFVVEDTIVETLKLPPFPGPLDAVREFVEEREGAFVVDRSREKYVLTYNPMGYLLRVGG